MPEKHLSVLSYAAGASLAAIALVYVFAPTHLIDENTSRKKAPVGLINVGNDCFINSVLQALAGLGDLRLYLIRELHRRNVDDPEVYMHLVQPQGKQLPEWELRSLQSGKITEGLKGMLDSLNERPIAKKTMSPRGFVRVMEESFGQTINRQQQDAQEFLQILAERLNDEYHAGRRARQCAKRKLNEDENRSANSNHSITNTAEAGLAILNGPPLTLTAEKSDIHPDQIEVSNGNDTADEDEDGFPMEGAYESLLECLTCKYKSKPRAENFCMLTLKVPRATTSLNSCFDEMFKSEEIADFKCEKCRLLHKVQQLEAELAKSTSAAFKSKAESDLKKLNAAIEEDPENPPKDVELPPLKYAPKRTISRTTRMSKFPKVLVIHLSRSIFEKQSQKNDAKVSFPENLSLGGLRDMKRYKLLAMVTHKGGHNSGHYESFRRQNVYPPYSNPNTFPPSGLYSRTASPNSTPQVDAIGGSASPMISTPDLLSASSGANSSTPSLDSTLPSQFESSSPGNSSRDSIPLPNHTEGPTSAPRDTLEPTISKQAAVSARSAALSKMSPSRNGSNHTGDKTQPAPPVVTASNPTRTAVSRPKKPKANDKWWRISDEKCRQARTSEVLASEREVYLLFYELDNETGLL